MDAKKTNLLLVDDQPDNLFVLKQVISRQLPACNIHTAGSAEEGLAIAEKMPLDGALIDVQMPHTSGIEMCRHLKSTPTTSNIPVLLITANRANAQIRIEGFDAGADDFINRPIDNTELIARIKVMLRVKRAEDELRATNANLEELVEKRTNQLMESQAWFRQAVLEAPFPTMVYAENGEALMVNKIWTDLTGYSAEDISKVSGWVEETFGIPPEQGDKEAQKLSCDGKKTHLGEKHVETRTGKCLIWDVRCSPLGHLPDERKISMYMATDITHRKEAETQLLKAFEETDRAREHIDTILKSVSCGLLVTDTNNNVTLINQAASDLLGFKHGDNIKHLASSSNTSKNLQKYITKTLTGNSKDTYFDLELSEKTPNKPQIIQARTSPVINRKGQKNGTITIMQDVTHERTVDRLKSEFISLAAHELRTPLTSIMGYSELLLNCTFDMKEQKEFLSLIVEKAEVLSGIVDTLLDVSRAESGRVIVLEKAPYILNESIKKLVNQYQHDFEECRFDLNLPDEALKVVADREKIMQVMENLLTNAVKYSESPCLIQIAGQLTDELCTISVQDNGIGMTPQQCEKAFDKFYRADTSNTAIGGIGLGLTIAKNIIEAHKGAIHIESTLGESTKVTFTIPRETASAQN